MDAERIGLFIAELRREKGLTQRQLAERLHVSFKAVSRWETGRGMPDIENREALSAELGAGGTERRRGERIERAIDVEDANKLTSSSLSLVRKSLRSRAVRHVAVGFLAGIIAVLAVIGIISLLQGAPWRQQGSDASALAEIYAADRLEFPTEEYVLEHGYPVNANGQTYGPPVLVDEPMPDLVMVVGNDGVRGYVYETDMSSPPPASIENALSGSFDDPYDIPVYKSDGVTVIGTFTMNTGG